MTRDETIEPVLSEKLRANLAGDVKMIADMLEYKRPHGSKSERRFINRFIRPLGVTQDAFGNLFKIIGDDSPKILWSAHTDSVHRSPGRQRVVLGGGHFKLSASEKNSSCLGADNAAGVWLLTELIKANVPGLYVFHRGEETGCLGSKHVAKNAATLLDGVQAAIAFDRRGTKSIITHQMSRRTCSETFAKGLGAALNMGHELDDGGSYTDTESYAAIIPECTNVSVGYASEHSSTETLNLGYLLLLKAALLEADFSKLEFVRDPKVEEYDHWGDYYGYGSLHSGGNSAGLWRRNERGGWSRMDDDRQPSMYRRPVLATTRGSCAHLENLSECRDLRDLVNEYPDEVADYLETMGVDPLTIASYIEEVWS